MREEQAITVREPDPPPDLTARFADTATHPTLLSSPIKEDADAIQTNFENNLASSPRTEGAR